MLFVLQVVNVRKDVEQMMLRKGASQVPLGILYGKARFAQIQTALKCLLLSPVVLIVHPV